MKKKILEHILHSEEESKAFAELFCKDFLVPALAKSSIQVSLCGILGAGKTFLSREIIAYFTGEKKANSPSFGLCHIYEAENLRVEHWDLYRLYKPEEELFELPSTGVLRLVEWADKFEPVLEMGEYEVLIEFGERENERRVMVSHYE